jgi:O-antigen chain-terminating methyltransferase
MSDRTGPQPSPIPPPDRHQLERLNRLYQIIDAPVAGGVRSRLASAARRLMGRVLSRQQEFNAAVVDHINRDAAVAVEAHEASLNTIEWISVAVNRCEAIQRYTESLLARERRGETAVVALAAQHDELRAAVSVLQQAAQTMKREVAKLAGGAPREPASPPSPSKETASQFDDLDSHKYVGFEDQFRGSPEDIRRRVAAYLPLFAEADSQGLRNEGHDVLDIGCGRGEFLELLRERGVAARGIDVNPAMVDICRAQGLDVVRADALTYLRGLPEGSLGGLFAAQVVEHLEPRYLTQLLDAAFDKLRPGAPIVLETINPACWFAFFESYIRDLTHVRPVHPDTLKYLLVATGFQHVEVTYRAPYPESDKLQPLAIGTPRTTGLDDLVETLNANVEKINRLLFTYLDYAAVGRRA